jgi:hypothetical protein
MYMDGLFRRRFSPGATLKVTAGLRGPFELGDRRDEKMMVDDVHLASFIEEGLVSKTFVGCHGL